LLALTRALYDELDGTEEILKEHPLPYRAMSWILQHHSSDDFPGNPRLSYQHQAMRIRGHRKEIRQARAWAVWALVCQIRQHLPGDTTMKELSLEEIAESLETFGLPQECELWRSCMLEQAVTSMPDPQGAPSRGGGFHPPSPTVAEASSPPCQNHPKPARSCTTRQNVL
jgi:hypothetical protein